MADTQSNDNAPSKSDSKSESAPTLPGAAKLNGRSTAEDQGNQLANSKPKQHQATVKMYFTKDGTPVEPSSIPAKEPFGPQPDVSKRPDVVEKQVPVDENGAPQVQ